ncbi:MAG: hypothetical protein QF609_03650, partial [Gammaproteobacteria bacterium]|nr:hypothetical protein [Gammaproteobacteria bacterium]
SFVTDPFILYWNSLSVGIDPRLILRSWLSFFRDCLCRRIAPLVMTTGIQYYILLFFATITLTAFFGDVPLLSFWFGWGVFFFLRRLHGWIGLQGFDCFFRHCFRVNDIGVVAGEIHGRHLQFHLATKMSESALFKCSPRVNTLV